MKRIPNLPVVHNMPFSEIDEKRSVLLVTSAPAWNAVKANLRGLNIIETIEVAEATTDYWDNLQSSIVNQKSEIVNLKLDYPKVALLKPVTIRSLSKDLA